MLCIRILRKTRLLEMSIRIHVPIRLRIGSRKRGIKMACKEFPDDCSKCPYEVECCGSDELEMEWSIWHKCPHEILYYRNGKYLMGQCKLCGYIQTMRLYNAELDDDWTKDDSP